MVLDNTVYKNGTSKGNIKYYISYKPEHKLEYVDPTGRTVILHRVIAKKDILIGDLETGKLIEAGTIGGYVEGGKNLSQFGCCWIDKHSIVCGDAQVKNDVIVGKNCVICEQALLTGNGEVSNSIISGNAKIHNADIKDSTVCDEAFLFSANYVPGFSLNVKSSFLDRNCFITNEGEGLSSISINKSYVTDDSIVNIYSESPNIVKRIYLNKSTVNGESHIAINTLNEEPLDAVFNGFENLIKLTNCQIDNSNFIINQTPFNLTISDEQIADRFFNSQELYVPCETTFCLEGQMQE